MGIYTHFLLQYNIIIDIQTLNIDDVLYFIRKIYNSPCIKKKDNKYYITIQEINEDLIKNKIIFDEIFTKDELSKISDTECLNLVLTEENKLLCEKIITKDFEKYILDHGWYKNITIFTTFDTVNSSKIIHDLEYIIELNIENNENAINLYKEKINDICKKNNITNVPKLYRQKTNNMIFIKIEKLYGKNLFETEYYKYYYPIWNLDTISMCRILITDNNDKLELNFENKKILDIILKSSTNIVNHGWYNTYY